MGGGTMLRKSPFDTWSEWRRKQAAGEQVNTWVFCAICWGQRRLWVRTGTPEGDVLVPTDCFACLGIGEVPTA